MRAAILTISDKGSQGQRADRSGPALAEFLSARGVSVSATAMVPDEVPMISQQLTEWADSFAADLILTTGGTGLSARDVTPEATEAIFERTLPGFAEAMRAASFTRTPNALISRAVSGVRGHSLILNLPGSPAGAVENLSFVWEAIPHAIRKLQGDLSDCAKP